MLRLKIKSIIAFVILALMIYVFRESQGKISDYLIVTVAIIIFWYLSGLKLAFSNLRNILILTIFFAALILIFRVILPIKSPLATMGMLKEFDLNPAKIALMKKSHERALEINFKNRPTPQERYFKIGDLLYTDDGLHYSMTIKELDPSKLPKTIAWVNAHLVGNKVDIDIDHVKPWFVGSMTYTLSPGTLNSSTPLDQFLFDRRAGFCEHFAAALSTILHLKGYRSRIAYGYAGGSWDPLSGVLTFEDADAHAWVEVFDRNTNQYKLIDPTSWICPEISRGRTVGPYFLKMLSVVLILFCLCGVFFVPRRSTIERFILKISKIERKHGLTSKGLTLSERISKIAPLEQSTAEKMLNSLKIYLEMYSPDRPIKKLDCSLKKSLAGW